MSVLLAMLQKHEDASTSVTASTSQSALRKGHTMSLRHFNARALQSGDILEAYKSADAFKHDLSLRISQISFVQAKADVLPFIAQPQVLDIWSTQYFLDLVAQMKIHL